jgi:hypothetical protein
MNVLSRDKQIEILAEGLGVSALARLTGVNREAVAGALVDATLQSGLASGRAAAASVVGPLAFRPQASKYPVGDRHIQLRRDGRRLFQERQCLVGHRKSGDDVDPQRLPGC